MFDFPNQDIVSDSYLFVRGANRYAYQRTRALAAVKSGKSGAAEAEKSAIRYHKVSIDRLCQINGIKRTTTLRIGQVLRCS